MVQPFPKSELVLPALSLGVCSWSLQVRSVAELKRLLERLNVNVVQIACGDPHHASWVEGDALPETARTSGIIMTGAMLGFPGEDYTSPQSIKQTGGFGNPAWRSERLQRLDWALERTLALGLSDLTLHAGFIPEPDDPDRSAMLDTLSRAGELARKRNITLAFETGQETALLLRPHSMNCRLRTSRSTSIPRTCCFTTWATRSGPSSSWDRTSDPCMSRTRDGPECKATGVRKSRSARVRSMFAASSRR